MLTLGASIEQNTYTPHPESKHRYLSTALQVAPEGCGHTYMYPPNLSRHKLSRGGTTWQPYGGGGGRIGAWGDVVQHARGTEGSTVQGAEWQFGRRGGAWATGAKAFPCG